MPFVLFNFLHSQKLGHDNQWVWLFRLTDHCFSHLVGNERKYGGIRTHNQCVIFFLVVNFISNKWHIFKHWSRWAKKKSPYWSPEQNLPLSGLLFLWYILLINYWWFCTERSYLFAQIWIIYSNKNLDTFILNKYFYLHSSMWDEETVWDSCFPPYSSNELAIWEL